jgi:osmoprotectant transport system ATP-binding protein
MIALVSPDTGCIRFENEILTRENAVQLRRKMGYVIQDGGLFPHLTARGNITLMARHLGWDSPRMAERVDELVQLTRFPHDGLDRYPTELSGGQRQRVSLMRALMLDPRLLLLDEPLGALDPMIRSKLQTELREIFQRLGKTVVMVTHDLAEADFFGDTIVLMRAGRIVQCGSLAELIESPAEPFVMDFVNAQRGAWLTPGNR